jgi:hypothetical protein
LRPKQTFSDSRTISRLPRRLAMPNNLTLPLVRPGDYHQNGSLFDEKIPDRFQERAGAAWNFDTDHPRPPPIRPRSLSDCQDFGRGQRHMTPKSKTLPMARLVFWLHCLICTRPTTLPSATSRARQCFPTTAAPRRAFTPDTVRVGGGG